MRRRLTVACAAVASTALIAACGSGDEPNQDGAASDQPQEQSTGENVASLGLGDADTLLALGISPTVLASWGTEDDGAHHDDSGLGPWAADQLDGGNPEVIYGTGQGFSTEILEKVASTQPEQIIAVNTVTDDQARKRLSDIAPATFAPEGYDDWQIPWDVQITTIAEAVDKADEGEQLIDDVEQAFADFRAAHPELQGKKAAIGMPGSSGDDATIGLYSSGDGRGQFIEALGMEIPEQFDSSDSFVTSVSSENFADLEDLDYLFVLDYAGAVDALRNSAAFTGLNIADEGRTFWFDELVGTAMSMPNPLTIPWVLENFSAEIDG